jgi:hypothetical protein
MTTFACRAIGVAIFLTCVLMITGFVEWEKGHLDAFIWNRNAVEVLANVTNHVINVKNCSYSCFFESFGSADPRNPKTCYRPCYDGSINIKYQVVEISYNASILVYGDHYDQKDVVKDLDTNYPIGIYITCYYDSRDPNDVRLNLQDSSSTLITFWILVVICGVLCVAWGVFEGIHHFMKKKGYIKIEDRQTSSIDSSVTES